MSISDILRDMYTEPIVRTLLPPDVAREVVLDLEVGPRYGPWRSDRYISHNPKRWTNPGLDLRHVLDPHCDCF